MQSNVRVSLGADRFRNDLKDLLPVLPGTKVGLAVSGGPDSMALAWLAQHTLHDVGLRIAVVDHGLRTDSAREAALVQERVAALGLHADILTWTPPAPVRSRKMERARLARYALLRQWALENGILRVWLGHHADDQRETIALRQAQGARGEGLRGMDAMRTDAEVLFERPVLRWSKADLLEICALNQLPFVSDPTNTDPKTGRGRLRAENAGKAAATMPASMPTQVRARTAGLVSHPLGHIWARRDGFGAPELRAACAWVRGGHYAPTARQTQTALLDLVRPAGRLALFGCVVENRSGGWILVTRETRRSNPLIPAQMEDGQWRVDDRWIVDQPGGQWAFLGVTSGKGIPGLTSRAAASCLTWNGQVPTFDGTRLVWAGNGAVFAPRRPLFVPLKAVEAGDKRAL